jgi:D-aminopeptidase
MAATGRRPRELGVRIGRLPTGRDNSITDVPGVRVGHVTISRDPVGSQQAVRTGVTVVWPHPDRPWQERVYAATAIVNGYGELIGINQIKEWGLLQTPVVLTSSLAIGMAYHATARWIADEDPVQGIEDVIMPVVTECDDSFLNDAWAFPVQEEHVREALELARRGGPVQEGSVGAATGLQCFEFKGGIGTASRMLPPEAGGYLVGALVSTNFGARADLLLAGVPLGEEITDLMPGPAHRWLVHRGPGHRRATPPAPTRSTSRPERNGTGSVRVRGGERLGRARPGLLHRPTDPPFEPRWNGLGEGALGRRLLAPA